MISFALFLLFLSCNSSIASAKTTEPLERYLNAETLTSEISMSSEFTIVQLHPSWYVESVSVDLSFFPREGKHQSIAFLETQPESTVADTLLFEWENPEETTINFRLDSEVITKNAFVRVTKKVDFPIRELPEEFTRLREPTGNIDSDNEEIIRTASRLAEGENDLYAVVFRIAEWVKKNVEYDLNTLTAEVSQPASWVLENRYGVCDEITTLFTALLRAVGIPAQYISGLAYTNINNMNDFGQHGWAEVYFPGFGWVPFDITYDEFGYVDASHIVLKRSEDSSEATTNYKWKGKHINVQTNKLEIGVETVNFGAPLEPLVRPVAQPYQKRVGFGSYNILEVSLKNNNAFYAPLVLRHTKSLDLEFIGDNTKYVLLAPFESRKALWIVKPTEHLSEGFVYTFRLGVIADRNASAFTEFNVTKGETAISKEDAVLLVSKWEDEEKREYSKELLLNCSAERDRLYINESTQITCSLKNTGNTFLNNLSVCLSECTRTDVGISQSKKVSFNYTASEAGKKSLSITAENNIVSRIDPVIITILDTPSIGVREIRFQNETGFREPYTVSFMLRKLSESNPKNVGIMLKQRLSSKTWTMDELSDDREFVINLNSADFSSKKEEFSIVISFEDERGRIYEEKAGFAVGLTGLSIPDNVVLFVNGVGASLDAFDLKLMIVAAFAFGIISGFILHGIKKLKKR